MERILKWPEQNKNQETKKEIYDGINNIIAFKKIYEKINNKNNIRCSVVNFIFLFNFGILDFF